MGMSIILNKSFLIQALLNNCVPPAANETRYEAKKQKAMMGVVKGTNQAINKETFTIPIAVADFVRLLIR